MPLDEKRASAFGHADHFDSLIRLLDAERAAERARLGEERQTLPLKELEARGRVLLDVELKEDAVGLGGKSLLTFAREDGGPLTTRLGAGDMLSVSPRKAELEERPPSGLVTRANRREVTLAFDRHPPAWISEGRLRLDVLSNDVTYERAKTAVRTIQNLEHGRDRHRREVLLGRDEPKFEKVPAFVPTRPLNPEQLDAVGQCLAAQDFFLVHGPPGTGKSTVLGEVAVQLAKSGARIVCTAASNAAVDHLLELCLDAGLSSLRVGHPARVLPHLQEHTLDLLVEEHPDRILARELFDDAFDLLGYARKQRTRGRSRARFSNAREAQAEAYKMMDDARVLERKALASVLGRAQVICATCASLDGHVLKNEKFDVALLDEATQAFEPTALMAFTHAPKVILAGDPQQLGPTLLSEEAKKHSPSLFERLLREHGDGLKRMLKEQYRMSLALMTFPSARMYQSQLRAHPSVANRTLAEVLTAPVDAPPLLFLDTAGKGFDEGRAVGSSDASLRNEGEAKVVEKRARELLGAGLSPRELAVITPYRAQAAFVRELLHDVPELEVDTIDAFQGREKDAVLISLVRSNLDQKLGFLEDLRRINVAITRARRHLFVVGDSATLSGHPFYAALVEEAQSQGGYRLAWEWPACADM